MTCGKHWERRPYCIVSLKLGFEHEQLQPTYKRADEDDKDGGDAKPHPPVIAISVIACVRHEAGLYDSRVAVPTVAANVLAQVVKAAPVYQTVLVFTGL